MQTGSSKPVISAPPPATEPRRPPLFFFSPFSPPFKKSYDNTRNMKIPDLQGGGENMLSASIKVPGTGWQSCSASGKMRGNQTFAKAQRRPGGSGRGPEPRSPAHRPQPPCESRGAPGAGAGMPGNRAAGGLRAASRGSFRRGQGAAAVPGTCKCLCPLVHLVRGARSLSLLYPRLF